jgi:peptide chain release factor 1
MIILELHAGEGGTDSKLFVDNLFAAYVKYALALGLKVELLDSDLGHVTARIAGDGVKEAFAKEAGKHCVQRVPPTEHKGRKQTSYVNVGVLPIRPAKEYQPLRPEDLETTCMIGTGPGGQHRQKTASCVRIIHLPTRISAVIDGRDQHTNRRIALEVLTARVNEARLAGENADYGKLRKAQLGDGGRGEKIRTYNFIKSRATDHRTGKKTSNIDAVMRGRFDLLC